eukprot:534948-Lingulodinium_polyedra.AAC.1
MSEMRRAGRRGVATRARTRARATFAANCSETRWSARYDVSDIPRARHHTLLRACRGPPRRRGARSSTIPRN